MNWWLIYLLSIMDIGVKLGVLSALGLVAGLFAWLAIIIIQPFETLSDECKKKAKENEDKERNFTQGMRLVIIGCLITLVTSFFMPSKKDLIQSYLMIEGTKIIKAENGELAAKEILKRIDRFIELIGEKKEKP